MPKNKAQKSAVMSSYRSALQNTPVAVVAEFEALTMVDLDSIRKQAKEQGINFQVVKNTILTVAAEEAGVKDFTMKKMGKMLALITGGSDVVSAPKLAKKIAKDTGDRLKIFAGIYENAGVGADIINKLASIPSREELLAKLVGTMNSPISGFVQVLNGNLRKFAYVIQAIHDKKSAA